MIKLIKKHLLNGIAWSCVALVANIIMFDLTGFSHLSLFLEDFTPNALGFIVVGIAFISTSGVYEIEQLKLGFKLLIHLIVGIGTLLIVGFMLGVFSTSNTSVIITNVLINVLILVGVWTGYYRRDKREIEEINERIKEKKLQRKLDTE